MAMPLISVHPSGIKDPPANPFAARRYGELHPVTDRVYILRNITNSSFVIGDRSVAVIDTQVNQPTAAELLKLIRTVTNKPIEYVINTHYHWDHTNGNALFQKQGAKVISSELTKEFMVKRAGRQKEFLSGRGFELGDDPLLPEICFTGETRLDLGNMPLRLFFAGCAESDDATAVHVERENVVMAGDTVMTGSFPIFGQPVWDEGLQGDGAWQKAIQNIMDLKPDHIIPGHGPLAYQKEVDGLLKIQNYFVEQIMPLVQKGYTIQNVLQELEPKLPEWLTKIPVVWGNPRYAILRVYRGLTRKADDTEPGWQKYKPSLVDLTTLAHEAEEGGDDALKLQLLQKNIEEHPESADALAAYAEALIALSRNEASVLEKGDFFSLARRSWDKALRLNSAHIPSLLGKGRYLTMMAYRGGDDPKAGMELLRKVLELNPCGRTQCEAEFYLGMGYRRLLDEEAARRQFDKAIQLDPAFMPAQLAKQA